MTRLLDYYHDIGRDGAGRLRRAGLAMNLTELEATHDYIQWLFPLPEPSGANPGAPVLSEGDIAAFNESAELQSRSLDALTVMLRFYGFAIRTTNPVGIGRAVSFPERSTVWLTPYNHNFLRLTRMLRSLTLLGLADDAGALLFCLEGGAGETMLIGSEVSGIGGVRAEPGANSRLATAGAAN